jgi:putative ATP-dependent endonuclease of the OLD family
MNDPGGLTVKNRIYTFFDHIFDIRKSDKLEVNIIEILNESVYKDLFIPVIGNENVAAGAED